MIMGWGEGVEWANVLPVQILACCLCDSRTVTGGLSEGQEDIENQL